MYNFSAKVPEIVNLNSVAIVVQKFDQEWVNCMTMQDKCCIKPKISTAFQPFKALKL